MFSTNAIVYVFFPYFQVFSLSSTSSHNHCQFCSVFFLFLFIIATLLIVGIHIVLQLYYNFFGKGHFSRAKANSKDSAKRKKSCSIAVSFVCRVRKCRYVCLYTYGFFSFRMTAFRKPAIFLSNSQNSIKRLEIILVYVHTITQNVREQ